MKKQNKDREEFKKIVGGYCWYQDGGNDGYSFEEVWSWIETHTQKKVEEVENKYLKLLVDEGYSVAEITELAKGRLKWLNSSLHKENK